MQLEGLLCRKKYDAPTLSIIHFKKVSSSYVKEWEDDQDHKLNC